MAQIARPASDVSIGNWVGDGGETSNLWDFLNDNSDAEYIKDEGNNTTAEFTIDSLSDPTSSTGHIIRFRMQGNGSGGPERCQVDLYEGATLRASSGTQTSRGAWATKSYTLSAAEADAISDYTNLRLKVISSNMGGAETMWVAWAELEVPDAGATYARSVTDGVKFGDSITKSIVLLSSLIDGIKFGDSITVIKAVIVSLIDGIKFGEAKADAIPSTRKVNQKFEGSGYDNGESWVENVGAGNTVDEDADTADVGSPIGWGSQCLKIDVGTPANTAVTVYTHNPPMTTCYVRLECALTAESMSDGTVSLIAVAQESSPGNVHAWRLYWRQDAVNGLQFAINILWDGTSNQYFKNNLNMNQIYRVEVKYDYNGGEWEWKVDGVSQNNGVFNSSPGTEAQDMDRLWLGHIVAVGGTVNYTTYLDNIAMDDTTWVGAETSVNAVLLANGNNSDGIQFSDSITGILQAISSLSDGVQFGDNIIGGLILTDSLTDGVKFSDSIVGIKAVLVSIGDGIQFSDSITGIMQAIGALTDGVKFGDTLVNVGLFVSARTDGVTFSDSIAGIKAIIVSISDGVSISDSSSGVGQLISSLIDGVQFQDSNTPVMIAVSNTIDGVKFGDTGTNTILITTSVSDVVQFADSVSGIKAVLVSLSDGVQFGDSSTNIAQLISTLSDQVNFSESTVNSIILVPSVSDGLKFSDSILNISQMISSVVDGVQLGDNVSNINLAIAPVTDGVKFSDSSLNIAQLIGSITDGVTFEDIVNAIVAGAGGIIAVSLSDGVKLGDSLTQNVTINISIADGIELGDIQTNVAQLIANISDGTVLTDSIIFTVARDGCVKITFTLTKPTSTFTVVNPVAEFTVVKPTAEFTVC
jgi:hypothetical protein